MFVNFHEMYKTTKAIRFVAARFLPAGRNKGWINGRSIIIMRICCTRLIEQAWAGINHFTSSNEKNSIIHSCEKNDVK